MGALRHPQHSSSFADDRPHLALSLPTSAPSLGFWFLSGVGFALLGATLMIAGAASDSACTVWIATGPMLVACVALRASLRTSPDA